MSLPVAYAFLEEHVAHDRIAHPENSRRLHAVKRLLADDHITDRLLRVPCPPVEDDRLLLVHTPRHIEAARTLSEVGGGLLDSDTYATASTFDVALKGVGGVVEVARAVARGEAARGMGIVRPPGHHAVPEGHMGFCIFNNIAVAARTVMSEFGIERAAIVDFDVHHGNGTQNAFYSDGGVLFISTHQYPFYPGTGAAEEIGTGDGRGFTVNVPLPAGSGDSALQQAFAGLLTDVVERFRPEFIFVSAGFDAHHSDPLGGLNASITGLADLVQIICGWADQFAGGRVVASLEGGYNTDALSYSVLATLEKLEDPETSVRDPLGQIDRREPDIQPLLARLRCLHGI